MQQVPGTPAAFYDNLAGDYHRIYRDWDASIERQGAALQALIADALGAGPHTILDCSVGIGTQLLGLAAHRHRLFGSDVSTTAVRRARAECAKRERPARLAVADMRALPFGAGCFDAVVCADNALPHLLTPEDVVRALREMRRVARAGGLVIVTTRDYDAARREHPTITPPQVHEEPGRLTITFQLWKWHADGRRYDLRHVQLIDDAASWRVAERRTVYWALTRAELVRFATTAGMTDPAWFEPDESGFFQPVMIARVPVDR